MSQPDTNKYGWDPPSQQPDEALQARICALSKLSSVRFENEGSQLDLHANMILCGKHCHILSRSGINATVSAFTDDVGTMQIPIVDAVIAYYYPDTTKIWLLIVPNVPYVESMDHNLIPPFILREGGMQVNDRPKIHHPTGTPTVTDHTFGNEKEGLRVSLKLSGIFYMFESRQPTDDDFINGVPIPFTPEGDDWNPNSSQFERNEDSFTDSNGNMLQKDHVDYVLIDDNDMMEDEWNHEYGLLADIESVAAMYADPVFTGRSIMYNKEAECASMMTDGV